VPASDSGPPLRPEGLAKALLPTTTRVSDQGYAEPLLTSSFSTGAVRAEWGQPTEDAHSVRTRKRTEKVRQGVQVKLQYPRPYPVHLPVPCDPPSMTELKQCCRRRCFPLQCCGRH